MARAGACRGAAVVAGQFCIDAAGAGDCVGQTVCGGDDSARVKRERPLHRLLHLLHAREYWRCSRTLHGFVGAPTHARGKCLSCGGVKRITDVFRGFVAVQRASAI